MKVPSSFSLVRSWVVRYERHLSVASMILGFIADNLFLRRPDLLPETLLIYFYLVSSGLLIFLIHLAAEGIWKGKFAAFLRPWLPIALQFIFGSWFSAFFVFYSRSASLGASWFFLLILLAIFVGTEIFRKYRDRLALQNAIYFFGIFSFSVFALPLALGTVGTGVFLLSGVVSVVVFCVFFGLLLLTGPSRLGPSASRILGSVAAIFIFMNVFYFAHLLPPLPLSLKDIGVYHSVVRTGAGYQALGEHRSLVSSLLGSQAVHIRKGDAVYVFSSVFTPVAIRTNLVHRWERWDASQKGWIVTSTVSFPVSGGRDGGYRGFSVIEGIPEGEWRVSVETPDRQLIGRITFTVESVPEEPALEKKIL